MELMDTPIGIMNIDAVGTGLCPWGEAKCDDACSDFHNCKLERIQPRPKWGRGLYGYCPGDDNGYMPIKVEIPEALRRKEGLAT